MNSNWISLNIFIGKYHLMTVKKKNLLKFSIFDSHYLISVFQLLLVFPLGNMLHFGRRRSSTNGFWKNNSRVSLFDITKSKVCTLSVSEISSGFKVPSQITEVWFNTHILLLYSSNGEFNKWSSYSIASIISAVSNGYIPLVL